MVGWALGAPEIFISYSRAGQCEVAKRLHEAIERQDWVALRDAEDIPEGTRWRGTIHGWLDSCDVAVVLLCPEAAKSTWVQDEVSILAHRFFRPESDLDALLLVRFGNVALGALGQGRLGAAHAPEIQSRMDLDEPASDVEVDAAVECIVAEIRRVLLKRADADASAVLRNRAEFHALDRLPTAPLPLKRMCSTLAPGRRIPAEYSQLAALAAVEVCRAEDPTVGIDPVFRSLAEPGHAYRLIELNLGSLFDGRVCDLVWAGGTPVILAVTDPLAARMAIDAALSAASRKDFAEFDIISVNVLADSSDAAASAAKLAEDVRQALADAAARGEARPGAKDPVRYLAARRGGDDRVFAVLNIATAQASERLTSAVIAAAVDELGENVVLVLACPDPALLAERLGLNVCGPAAGEARDHYVDLGARLVHKRFEYLDWLETTWNVTDPRGTAA